MKEKFKILLVVLESINEAYAIRSFLESMGAVVITKFLGRPNDFIEVLKGDKTDYNFLIISGHGKDEKFIMPELDLSIYEDKEPKNGISSTDIKHNLNITDKIIISTACKTGVQSLLNAFTEKGNIYIAPIDYIESTSALFFVNTFFYQLIARKKSLAESFYFAKNIDDETNLFVSNIR